MSDDPFFGDGIFAFGAWSTPFENASVHIFDVALKRGWEPDAIPQFPQRVQTSTEPSKDKFTVRLRVDETGLFYRVHFEIVSAFRVLDESGLLGFWEKTNELGGRPAQTTFKVRNSLWTRESPISFIPTDGWCYVIATDWDCIEVVTNKVPIIEPE